MSNRIELSEDGRAAYERLVDARSKIAYYREIESESRAAIEAELGEAYDVATVDGAEVVTYTYVKSNRLDTAALKREIPDLYAGYVRPTESRRFVVKP